MRPAGDGMNRATWAYDFKFFMKKSLNIALRSSCFASCCFTSMLKRHSNADTLQLRWCGKPFPFILSLWAHGVIGIHCLIKVGSACLVLVLVHGFTAFHYTLFWKVGSWHFCICWSGLLSFYKFCLCSTFMVSKCIGPFLLDPSKVPEYLYQTTKYKCFVKLTHANLALIKKHGLRLYSCMLTFTGKVGWKYL